MNSKKRFISSPELKDQVSYSDRIVLLTFGYVHSSPRILNLQSNYNYSIKETYLTDLIEYFMSELYKDLELLKSM